MSVQAFVLAKNEEANIGRCVQSLVGCGVEVIVLDSGSTDNTVAVARSHGACVETRAYVSHCEAYRYICTERSPAGSAVLVVDSDMMVSSQLIEEALSRLASDNVDVVAAPVLMYWGGKALRHGSLCPPKPILFRGGSDYFEPVGHGERLRQDVAVAVARNRLIHDDRKPFGAFLASQARYSDQFVVRTRLGRLSLRDRVRRNSPAMVFLVPLVSLFVKGGILCGRRGLGYAMDRLIAEAVMYRQSLATEIEKPVGGATDKV